MIPPSGTVTRCRTGGTKGPHTRVPFREKEKSMELDITALDMLPAREESSLARCQVTSFTCENEGNSCYVTR